MAPERGVFGELVEQAGGRVEVLLFQGRLGDLQGALESCGVDVR